MMTFRKARGILRQTRERVEKLEEEFEEIEADGKWSGLDFEFARLVRNLEEASKVFDIEQDEHPPRKKKRRLEREEKTATEPVSIDILLSKLRDTRENIKAAQTLLKLLQEGGYEELKPDVYDKIMKLKTESQKVRTRISRI